MFFKYANQRVPHSMPANATSLYYKTSIGQCHFAFSVQHKCSPPSHVFTTALHMATWGDAVAQLVERRTRDPKDQGSNPVSSTRKNCVPPPPPGVKNVVLTRCRCAQPLCVYARTRMIMYAL